MSKEGCQMNDCREKKKININLGVTLISMAAIIAFVAFMVRRPGAALGAVSTAFNFATQVFSVPLMLLSLIHI